MVLGSLFIYCAYKYFIVQIINVVIALGTKKLSNTCIILVWLKYIHLPLKTIFKIIAKINLYMKIIQVQLHIHKIFTISLFKELQNYCN